MYEKQVKLLVIQSCPTLCDPVDCSCIANSFCCFVENNTKF